MGGFASAMISRVTAHTSLLCTCLAQGRSADRALKSGCCRGSSLLWLLLEGGFLSAIRPAWVCMVVVWGCGWKGGGRARERVGKGKEAGGNSMMRGCVQRVRV